MMACCVSQGNVIDDVKPTYAVQDGTWGPPKEAQKENLDDVFGKKPVSVKHQRLAWAAALQPSPAPLPPRLAAPRASPFLCTAAAVFAVLEAWHPSGSPSNTRRASIMCIMVALRARDPVLAFFRIA